MKSFSHITLLIAIFFSTTLQMSAESKKDNIYAFAYGSCFNDSTIYLSSISHLTIAHIDKKSKLLNDRNGYSTQFKNYLDKEFTGHHTCTIFFSKNRKKLEKKFVKVRRMWKKDKESKVVEIPISDFTLQ